MDLSKLSTDELIRMRDSTPAVSTDLSKIPTDQLMKMRGSDVAPSALDSFDAAAKSFATTGLKNIALGAVKGASDIGRTFLKPADFAADIANRQPLGTTNKDRAGSISDLMKDNAEPESLAFKGGELGADIAGTAGVGGAIAKTLRAIPAVVQYAPRLAAAIESGGFTIGGPAAKTAGEKIANAALRTTGGAIAGGASAGLVDPADAPAGMALGGALPGAAKLAGEAGKAIVGKVSPEVAALYQRAKDLGIDVPADRLANSKPLNAVAASLNYVPFSGRAGAEEKMMGQLDRAVSRTFGQDSDNVTAALRTASKSLGSKFESTLQGNTVKADNELINDLVGNIDKANRELGADGAKIIGNMAEEIMSKVGANGEIDGQAAYNIKKSLDRIGDRNSPESYYAREMKKSLMGALNRSLGPDEAKAFAKVRQQYGNMLDVEGLAQNGAEGGVSIGRLANMKNIGNKDLQELADIAAQFVKTRESPHGAAQRVTLGVLGGAAGLASHAAIPAVGGTIAAARLANTALNSDVLKKIMLDPTAGGRIGQIAGSRALRALLYNSPTANP